MTLYSEGKEIPDFQDIASTEVATGAPITAELLQKIQNNHFAYAQRDSSVYDKSLVYTAGNTVFAVMSIERSTGTTTRNLRLRAGTFRMKFRTYVASSTWTGQVGFKKNGSFISSANTTATFSGDGSETGTDVTVADGDVIEASVARSSGSGTILVQFALGTADHLNYCPIRCSFELGSMPTVRKTNDSWITLADLASSVRYDSGI
tara:strand:+ start:4427 stop:5044 length:618 start_codon:yes stop_codon:yes gene_type:complete